MLSKFFYVITHFICFAMFGNINSLAIRMKYKDEILEYNLNIMANFKNNTFRKIIKKFLNGAQSFNITEFYNTVNYNGTLTLVIVFSFNEEKNGAKFNEDTKFEFTESLGKMIELFEESDLQYNFAVEVDNSQYIIGTPRIILSSIDEEIKKKPIKNIFVMDGSITLS